MDLSQHPQHAVQHHQLRVNAARAPAPQRHHQPHLQCGGVSGPGQNLAKVASNGALPARPNGRSTPSMPTPALAPPHGGAPRVVSGAPQQPQQHPQQCRGHSHTLPAQQVHTASQRCPEPIPQALPQLEPEVVPMASGCLEATPTLVTYTGSGTEFYAATPAGTPPTVLSGSFQNNTNGVHGTDGNDITNGVDGGNQDAGEIDVVQHDTTQQSFMPRATSLSSSAPAAAVSTVAPVVPTSFRCSLTGQVMHDPVATCDGQVYELAAIEEWFFQGHRSSPVTGVELETLTLTPQFALQAAIQAFMSHPAAPQAAASTYAAEKGGSASTAVGVASAGSAEPTPSTSSTAAPFSTPVPCDGILEEEPGFRREDQPAAGNWAPPTGSAVSSATASPGPKQQSPQQQPPFHVMEGASSARQGGGASLAAAPSRPEHRRLGTSSHGHGTVQKASSPSPSRSQRAGGAQGARDRSRARTGGGQTHSSRSPSTEALSPEEDAGRHGESAVGGASETAVCRRGPSQSLPSSQRGPRRPSPSAAHNHESGTMSSPATGRSGASASAPAGGSATQLARTTPRKFQWSGVQSSGYGPKPSPGASARAQSPGTAARAAAGAVAATAQAQADAAPGLSSSSIPRRGLGLVRRSGLGGGAVGSSSSNSSPTGAVAGGQVTRRSSSPARPSSHTVKQHQQQLPQQHQQRRHIAGQPGSVNASGARAGLGGSRSRQMLDAAPSTWPAADSVGSAPYDAEGPSGGPQNSPTAADAPADCAIAGAPGDAAAGSRLEGCDDVGAGFAPSILGLVDKVVEEEREDEKKAEEEEAEAEAENRFAELPRDVDATDEAGRTPLMHAAGEGEPEALRFLIVRGAKVDAVDECRCTALMYAATYGHKDAVKCLVEHGAAVEATSKDGWTPLITAAYNGHIEVVRFLLSKGARIEAADERGWTSLMHVAFNGDNETLRCLLENRAQVDALDSDGRTALVYAAFNGHLDNVRCLLDGVGKDENRGAAADGARDTALLFAAIHGHEEVVRQLLEVAAASPETRHAALKLAADHGHHAVVELLVRRSAVELQLGGR